MSIITLTGFPYAIWQSVVIYQYSCEGSPDDGRNSD